MEAAGNNPIYIIQDICIDNLRQLKTIYGRLKHNFPNHGNYSLWTERQAYWSTINEIQLTHSFETEQELRAYILSYTDELVKIEDFAVVAFLAYQEKFLS
jgi:hypothetical protein